MKKHLISLLVLFLMVSTSLMGVSNQVTDDSSVVQEDSYQYMTDWSVHLTNETLIEDAIVFYSESYDDTEMSPLSGPMDSPWSMFGYEATHTCRSPYGTENNTGDELWLVRGVKDGAIWCSAVIDNMGIVYFGTQGSDHSLYAMYPNGTQKWRFVASGAIWVSPALADNGDIYCTTWGALNYLQAITPDGTERWRFYQESSSASAPTIGPEGTIYFGTDDHTIFAINPGGTEKWRYTTDYIVMGSAAIYQDNTIYIGSGDNYLYALNPNGTLRWRFQTGDHIKGSASIGSDGTIYVPSFDGYLYALYPNGTMRWKVPTGTSIAGAGVALAEDGTIYIGTELLRAYYPNGTLRWELDVQGNIYGTIPAVSGDGTIYVSAGNCLVAVNPNGTEKWRVPLSDEQVRSPPVIGPDDRVYVGSENQNYGYFHAFGPGEPKKLVINQPEQGKVYLFGIDLGKSLLNDIIIIGSVNVKVHAYSQDEIESVNFYVDGINQYNLTTPPFEWRMNQRYGNLFPLKHTITVTGYYMGGYTWSESIDVLYFHFLR